MKQTPFEWRRGSRSSFSLSTEPGVYALFLREGSMLPGVATSHDGLLYLGLAANRNGLRGRCHFEARTRNHSPRKSLAVLLMEELSLTPVLITKPNSSDTWGLDGQSDARLSGWMHANLDLAIEICADPNGRETELVGRYAPPLNLTKCVQTQQHRLLSQARADVMAALEVRRKMVASGGPILEEKRARPPSATASDTIKPAQQELRSVRQFVGSDVDTAEAIAARYGLNSKSYRQRLRDSIRWYRKPQDWTFPVSSIEWRDMIAVAEKMAR